MTMQETQAWADGLVRDMYPLMLLLSPWAILAITSLMTAYSAYTASYYAFVAACRTGRWAFPKKLPSVPQPASHRLRAMTDALGRAELNTAIHDNDCLVVDGAWVAVSDGSVWDAEEDCWVTPDLSPAELTTFKAAVRHRASYLEAAEVKRVAEKAAAKLVAAGVPRCEPYDDQDGYSCCGAQDACECYPDAGYDAVDCSLPHSPTLAAMLAVLRAPDLSLSCREGQPYLRSEAAGAYINTACWNITFFQGPTYYPSTVLPDGECVVWRDACQDALRRLALPSFELMAGRASGGPRA